MHKIGNIIFWAIIAYFILNTWACSSKNDKLERVVKIIHIENGSIKLNVPIDHYFDSIQFVKLKMPSKHFIKWANKIVEHNDKFYIEDNQSNKLMIFNPKGKFINYVGRIGEGPGEYLEIDKFYIDSYRNELLLYDNGNQKVIYFDENGIYQRESKYMCYFGDRIMVSADTVLMFTQGYDNQYLTKGKNYSFLFSNAQNRLFKGLKPFRNEEISKDKDGILGNFSLYDEKILFCQSFNDTISDITYNDINSRYIIKFQKNSISQEAYNDPKMQISLREVIEKNYPYLSDYFIENKKACYLIYIYNGGAIHLNIFDKKENQSKINASSITFKDAAVPIPSFWTGKSFVAFMSPEEVGFFRKISKFVEANTTNEDADENSNQTLVIFKPKID